MSAISTVTSNVTAPIGWAKAKPFGWALFVLVIILVAIRFREKIAAGLAKIPGIGKWLTGIAAAGAFVLFGHLGAPRVPFIETPATPIVESCAAHGYAHGHRVMVADSSNLRAGALGGFLDVPAVFSGKGGAT